MADRSDLAPSAMANLLIFCGSTPEKQRTLLITMIQEIQRPVKCQKLNKFTSRNRKLSVKQAKDQSLACSGLCRPLRSNVVGNRTVPSLAGSMKVFRGLPRSCPPQGAVPPTNALWPTATNRLTPAAAAGIPVRFAHSNVVGTYGSLPGRFHESFMGIAKELPAARRGSPHKRPVAYGHKPAYAGRCGGNSASLKCGREPDGSPHKRPPPWPVPLGFSGKWFLFSAKGFRGSLFAGDMIK